MATIRNGNMWIDVEGSLKYDEDCVWNVAIVLEKVPLVCYEFMSVENTWPRTQTRSRKQRILIQSMEQPKKDGTKTVEIVTHRDAKKPWVVLSLEQRQHKDRMSECVADLLDRESIVGAARAWGTVDGHLVRNGLDYEGIDVTNAIHELKTNHKVDHLSHITSYSLSKSNVPTCICSYLLHTCEAYQNFIHAPWQMRMVKHNAMYDALHMRQVFKSILKHAPESERNDTASHMEIDESNEQTIAEKLMLKFKKIFI